MRSETITSYTDTSKTITFTRYDDDRVVVSFDFYLNATAVYFTIPDWCLPREEEYTFVARVLLDSPAPLADIDYRLTAIIKNYNEMSITAMTAENYKGSFEYHAKATTGAFILDGVRLTCIAATGLTVSTSPVMYQHTRNHQGELIASETLDTILKRTFSITTIPVAERSYQLCVEPDVWNNTINEMDTLLYTQDKIGAYRVFSYRGVDYTVLVDDDIRESEQAIWLPGNVLQYAKIYNFTLVEV